MLDYGHDLNHSFTVAGLIIPSGTVVVFVVTCGRSWRIGLSLTQDSGINTEIQLLKIIFKSEFECSASWIMSRDFKLLICSLNRTSSDTTGHETRLGAGLSLAGGSGDFFILPQLYFLMA